MTKNLIFDMGGVLIHWDPSRIVKRLGIEGEDARLLLREVFRELEWPSLDRGSMSEEQAISAICARLPERLHAAVERCVYWWRDPLWPIEGMEELLRELKGLGYPIYLLSNATSALHEYFPRIPGSDCFVGGLVSADHKLLKPQHEIFELLFETFSLRPEDCLFIDDAPYNIEGAARVGLDGIVFQGDVAELRRRLRAKGIPVKSED